MRRGGDGSGPIALAIAGLVALGAVRAGEAASFFETPIQAHDAAAGDGFGFAISISANTVIVGAPFDDDAGASSGGAYIFERDVGGTDAWGQRKKLAAADASVGVEFGFAVAISANTIVVGAPFHGDAGAAYVFERDAGGAENWGQVRKLVAPDAAVGAGFGYAVAIDGDVIVIGAPFDDAAGADAGAVYVFERNVGGSGNWGMSAKRSASEPAANEMFGLAVAIGNDTALVGAPSTDAAPGSAYVLERTLSALESWAQTRRLSADDAEAGDQFGSAVSIDGDTLLVGARLATERVETARPPTPSDPTPDPNVTEFNDAGAAYFFERNRGGTGNWGQAKRHTASNLQEADQFGTAVALLEDRAVIGSPFAGANRIGSAYVRDRDRVGRGEWGQLEKLSAGDATRWDEYGASVSLGADTIAVGAPNADAACEGNRSCDSGVVYVYARTQTAEQQRCINALNSSLFKVWSAHASAHLKCAKSYAKTGASAEACLAAPNRAIEGANARTLRWEIARCKDPLPDFGATDAETVNSAAMQLEADVTRDIFGEDLDGSLVTFDANDDAARCQHSVIQSVNRCQRSKLTAFNRCKKRELNDAKLREGSDLEGCFAEVRERDLTSACQRLGGSAATQGVTKRCLSPNVDLRTAFPGCGAGDPPGLMACTRQAIDCRICIALNEADDLALDCDRFDDSAANASCP